MGRITEALKKVRDERIARIQKKPKLQYVVRKAKDTNIDEHVVAYHDPSSPVGEQYKILRNNLQSLEHKKGYKAFVITSSIHGEGKTISAINLSMTMAQEMNQKSVLLIDADMRKGSVSKYLGIKRSPGLSEVLNGEIDEDSAFINPDVENLTVLLSGKAPKNPSELLNSRRTQQLMESLKARFDYIFIDAPPIMPLADACIISPLADGVILAIQGGRTQRDTVKHVENRLHQARAKIIGYIMTSIEYHIPHYLYRYMHEYGHYDSYYKESQVNKREAVISS